MTLGVLVIGGGFWRHHYLQIEHFRIRLLTTDSNKIVGQRDLVDFAERQAMPLYASKCAGCHGADMSGNQLIGAPNLTDAVWLYGDGSVFDIERTLLYGIRSEQSKSHHVTDMPAFGLTGILTDGEIRDVVQYVLQLSGRAHRGLAASDGRAVYKKANCSDCHGNDARGNSDYGAPDLSINVWNSGGDEKALYDAIYYGQHHVMPAWIDTLNLAQIRSLAVYVHLAHERQHP